MSRLKTQERAWKKIQCPCSWRSSHNPGQWRTWKKNSQDNFGWFLRPIVPIDICSTLLVKVKWVPKTSRIHKQDKRQALSFWKFYAYNFVVCDNFTMVLRYNELTCELIVDMYAKMETKWLFYLPIYQPNMTECRTVHGLVRCHEQSLWNVNKQVVLSASLTFWGHSLCMQILTNWSLHNSHGQPKAEKNYKV